MFRFEFGHRCRVEIFALEFLALILKKVESTRAFFLCGTQSRDLSTALLDAHHEL